MLDRLRVDSPPRGPSQSAKPAAAPTGADFAETLAAQQAGLKFSAHAQQRLAGLPEPLDGQALSRIEAAVSQAAKRGAKESLVLYDDLALVVSVRNRTVITAVDAARRRANLFTNVDSVVIVEGGEGARKLPAREA